MPPPRSRMRMVTPGMEDVGRMGLASFDNAFGDVDWLAGTSSKGDSAGSGDLAMVISIGSRSLPLSMVARKAFFNSSVSIYSKCVGT